MRMVKSLILAGAWGMASAQLQGFNYGNQRSDGSGIKVQADYEAEFTNAKNLVGTNGRFTSARLYTMLQNDGSDDPISAIPAAIATRTSLLLGLWASAGDAAFQLQLSGLRRALTQYQGSLNGLLQGISVGSEDMYRASSLSTDPNPGVGPDTIANYVAQVKAVVAQSAFAGTPVGHVDTWNAWTNGSNAAAIAAVDFIGMNGFPYFQSTDDNTPDNLAPLFQKSLDATRAVSNGKPIWLTETGFPVTGPTYNQAVPGIQLAQRYYNEVGCNILFGKLNTWWYIQQDAPPPGVTPAGPTFGVVGFPLSTTPLYDLSCAAPSSSATQPEGTSLSTTVSLHSSESVAVPSRPVEVAGDSTTLSLTIQPTQGAGQPDATAGPSASQPSTFATQPSAGTGASQPSNVGPSNNAPSGSQQGSGSGSDASQPTNPGAGSGSAPPSSIQSSTSSTSSSCPADLNGSFEFPHLIVTISSTQPNAAQGTQYFGTVNSTTSTLFDFDIPASYAGRTCSVVFLFPTRDQLVWSDYDFNNQGGLAVSQLPAAADQGATFANAPQGTSVGAVSSLQSGNGYVVSSGPCAAGQALGYRVDSTGGAALNYFQDFNPAGPIGLYVRVC